MLNSVKKHVDAKSINSWLLKVSYHFYPHALREERGSSDGLFLLLLLLLLLHTTNFVSRPLIFSNLQPGEGEGGGEGGIHPPPPPLPPPSPSPPHSPSPHHELLDVDMGLVLPCALVHKTDSESQD